MNNLETIAATLILIAPGFAAYSLYTYIIGFRAREVTASVIWSLVFATSSFVILNYLSQNSAGLVNSITDLGRLEGLGLSNKSGTSINELTISEISTGFIKVLIVSCLLAAVVGKIVKAKPFRNLLEKATGHSYHVDVWNDFFMQPLSTLVVVVTKDDQEYFGEVLYTSDIPTNKAIVISNVKYRNKEGKFEDYIDQNLTSRLYIPAENINRIFQVK